jgi:hypothetical protein
MALAWNTTCLGTSLATMTLAPSFPCEGGCACSAVRYRLLEDPLGLHICHCTDCQDITGTAFIMSMPTRRSSLELIAGKPEIVEFETRSAITQRNRGCTSCGTRLWSEGRSLPEFVTLRPGTLEDTSWLTPIAHIWTVSKQPWVVIPQGVLQFDRGIEDYTEIVRLWKQRNTP